MAGSARSEGLPAGTGVFAGDHDELRPVEWSHGRLGHRRSVQGVDLYHYHRAMVTRHATTTRCPANARSRTEQGALATECVIAMSILAVVMLPLAFSFLQETKLLRVYYHRAIALEIIDGEMEKLAAGE